MTTTAKITKKGQVTIPQKIRERLSSEVVEFAVVGNDIFLRPVRSVAGSLSSYAKKGTMPFKEAREEAWEQAVKEKHGEEAHRR